MRQLISRCGQQGEVSVPRLSPSKPCKEGVVLKVDLETVSPITDGHAEVGGLEGHKTKFSSVLNMTRFML